MSKRRRGDSSITGGTGDINPQFMSFSIKQTSADAASAGSVQPPVSLSTGENLAMEILRVYVQLETESSFTNSSTNNVRAWLSTKNFSSTAPVLQLGDATVITDNFWSIFVATAVGTNTMTPGIMQVYDFTDGAGHGVLLGNQNLYWGLTSSNTGATNIVSYKILYRAKRISQSELLGIVLQSNQN